ncbi:recombinase family protein [Roseibium sp. M-1]
MTLAVIYTRVSSATQVMKGDGLASQEHRCREFAAYKNYEVAEVFRDEGVSGGDVNRPGFKSMMIWLNTHRSMLPVVLIDDVSRLARDTEVHRKLRNALGAVGARLESPSIEFGEDADSMLFENIVASMAQHFRQKNGEQVRHRMKARLMNGYFTFWAPTGYRYARVKAHSGKFLVRDDPDAAVIETALCGFATGRFQTQSDVKRFLESHSIFARNSRGEIHPQRIKNLLTNKIYAGYYEYEPWGVPLTKGKHEALITWDAFQRIQARLRESAYAPVCVDTEKEFPLKGHVVCHRCTQPLTVYRAKGRSRHYFYYECFNNDCDEKRKSIKKDVIEKEFEEIIKKIRSQENFLLRDVSSNKKVNIKSLASKFSYIWQEDEKFQSDDESLAVSPKKKLCETGCGKVFKEWEVVSQDMEEREYLENWKHIYLQSQLLIAVSGGVWRVWELASLSLRGEILRKVFAKPLRYARNIGFCDMELTSGFKFIAAYNDNQCEA